MKNASPYIKKALHKYYPDKAAKLVIDFNILHHQIMPDVAFASRSRNPIDRRMDFAAQFLALVKLLEKEGATYEKIREISLEIANEYVTPKTSFGKSMKKLPVMLIRTRLGKWLVKWFRKKAAIKSHPDGFVANIITDKNETNGLGYGVDILECGICKLFNKHQYQQYTSILCEVDHITTNLAGLRMTRSGTIALGFKKCDFRYEIAGK